MFSMNNEGDYSFELNNELVAAEVVAIRGDLAILVTEDNQVFHKIQLNDDEYIVSEGDWVYLDVGNRRILYENS